MANAIAALLRNSRKFSLSRNVFSPQLLLKLQRNHVRNLYSHEMLGLDGFRSQCEKTKANLANIADKFKEKMRDYSAQESKSMIFTEDLKNIIYLAENDDDVEVVINMMKKFQSQSKGLRFGNFVFGPVVMRMFHNLNKPDEALQCFKDPDLEGFFDQLISSHILLDLLYENKRYQEILDLSEVIKERQVEGKMFSRSVVVLILAACYKLNTKESMNFALKLWSELNEMGHLPMRRAVTFCAATAYNQGNYEAALEVLSLSKNQTYFTVRNLKIACYAALGRLEDIIAIFKTTMNEDVPTNVKHTINREILNKVKEAVDKSDDLKLKTDFSRYEKLFVQQGMVSDESLDEKLSSEIPTPPHLKKNVTIPGTNRYKNYNTFKDRRSGYNSRAMRPGLVELQ